MMAGPGWVGGPALQKVVVHIGAPKAASTSIQSFLRHNASRLREQGICPLDKFLVPVRPHGGSRMGPHMRSDEILTGPGSATGKISSLVDLYCSALDTAARASECDRLVFFAENLTRLNADRDILIAAFQQVARRFDQRLVLYARRPDLWLESSWKQWVFKVCRASPAHWAIESAGQGFPDFLSEARAWSAGLGLERLLVRVLDPVALWNEAVLQDFAELVGATGLDTHFVNENRMLHPAVLRFFHRHADLLFQGPYDTRLFKWAEVAGLFARPGQRLLSAAVRHRVLTLLSDSSRAFLTEFCPNEAPALTASWCPSGPAMVPASDLDLSRSVRGLAPIERLAARGLAQALRLYGLRLKR
jgi:hypothetical protein